MLREGDVEEMDVEGKEEDVEGGWTASGETHPQVWVIHCCPALPSHCCHVPLLNCHCMSLSLCFHHHPVSLSCHSSIVSLLLTCIVVSCTMVVTCQQMMTDVIVCHLTVSEVGWNDTGMWLTSPNKNYK